MRNNWRQKYRDKRGIYRNFSIIGKLRREDKITEEFEIMFNNLSLEEIIGLKLELASKAIGGKLYGLKLWFAIPNIAHDAIMKYIISASRTKSEAARFLGVNLQTFNKLIHCYETDKYFKNEQKNI